MSLTLYDDETEAIALLRYQILVKEFKAWKFTPTPEHIVTQKVYKQAAIRLDEERTRGFKPKKGQTFIQRVDDIVHYVECKGKGLTYFAGDTQLFSLATKDVITGVHSCVRNQICIEDLCQNFYRATLDGSFKQCPMTCKITSARTFVEEERPILAAYRQEFLSLHEKEESARMDAEVATNKALLKEYASYVDYLSMRAEIIRLDPSYSLIELNRVARPLVKAEFGRYIRIGRKNRHIIPGIKLKNHNELSVLDILGRSIVLPKLSEPKNWTLNRDLNGYNRLSISTVKGWKGFDLTTGSECEPIPYQLNKRFERLDLKHTTMTIESMEICCRGMQLSLN